MLMAALNFMNIVALPDDCLLPDRHYFFEVTKAAFSWGNVGAGLDFGTEIIFAKGKYVLVVGIGGNDDIKMHIATTFLFYIGIEYSDFHSACFS